MTTLITGAAGFIGMHLVERLLARGETVVGFDNRSGAAEWGLPHARADRLAGHPRYTDIHGDLIYPRALEKALHAHQPDTVVHLAARADPAACNADPHACAGVHLTGTLHLLEACRAVGIDHLLLASTAAVYDPVADADAPTACAETAPAAQPADFHAASRRAAELLAHGHAAGHGVPVTVARLFSVHGPWCRPDQIYSDWARRILAGEPVAGMAPADHLDIGDAVDALEGLLDAGPPPAAPTPWRICNIARGEAVEQTSLVHALATALGQPAPAIGALNQAAWPLGDSTPLRALTGWQPRTDPTAGMARFAAWYGEFHGDDDMD